VNDARAIEAVLTPHLGVLARAMHERYVADAQTRGETRASNPSLTSWEDLPESLKESNRAAVRHIPSKLAAIGCCVEGADDSDAAFAFTQDELERLAEMEHDRWWLDRVLAGWTLGEQKSTASRAHPDLVPWSELLSSVQDVDRAAVVALPDVLAAAGLRVVRIDDVSTPLEDLVELLDRCVPAFVALRPRFDELGRVLTGMLRELARAPAPTAIVTARTKSASGFVEKVVRKFPKYDDPLRDITDLCGVRVIARTRNEVDAVARLVESTFTVDAANSVSHTDRLHPSEFGYRSVHYIVSIPPRVDIGTGNADLHELKAEIQLRTIAEHASADFDHDFSYKGAFTLPERWQRELAITAAQVETIDEAFVRIEDGLRVYANSYGAYLGPVELRAEIGRLRVMCAHAPQDADFVARLGRLLRASGELAEAEEVLGEYVAGHPESFTSTELGHAHATILCDLGDTLCLRAAGGSNDEDLRVGREFLERAATALTAPVDRAHAYVRLGDSWEPGAERRRCYEQAFAADPTDASALTRYIESLVGTGTAEVVVMLRPAIDQAIARSRAQIDVGVNLPRALAAVGELLLLRGDVAEAVDCYTKSLRASSSAHVVDEALRALDNLRAPSAPPGLEWVRLMLMLGTVLRFRSPSHAVELVERATREGDSFQRVRSPVVIVLGATSGPDGGAEHADLLREAFRDFSGTILPIPVTGSPELDPEGGLQPWIDLFASGICADDVTVLGVTGRDATFDLRVALALGARVGVVQQTGREAAALLGDDEWDRMFRDDWAEHDAQLVVLPDDPQTVRAFVGRGAAQLARPERALIGQMVHDAYRDRVRERALSVDTAIADFDELPEHLRESNLRQADHIFTKLHDVGCDVASADAAAAFDGFDAGDVERLAQMEHGRWCAEKLSNGYVWGEHYDDAARTHPLLVSWKSLPEHAKELNRAAVREIPKQLGAVGLVIVRRPPALDR
jgi:ppGpp synthetase/RelA/SpoT-type nucleotidyltranferase